MATDESNNENDEEFEYIDKESMQYGAENSSTEVFSNSSEKLNTSVDSEIEGIKSVKQNEIQIVGDNILGDKRIQGDEVHRDKVMGDKITYNIINVVLDESQLIEMRRDNWSSTLKIYLDQMYEQHSTIRLLGHSEPISLKSIYTDIYILDEVTARLRYDVNFFRQRGEDRFDIRHQSQTRHNGFDLISSSGRNFFILGKPGAGKSTLLRFIVLQALTGNLTKIPIFVSLNEMYNSGITDLFHFIMEQFEAVGLQSPKHFLSDLLRSGNAIVLLDGLDEVNEENDMRRKLSSRIESFVQKYTRCQFLITCRIAASDAHFPRFQDVEIADFTREQIAQYAMQWFGPNHVKYNTFTTDLQKEQNKALRELCTTPLLLSMLCLAFDKTARFPLRRVDLYEEAIDVLINQWDASRSISRDSKYKTISIHHKVRLFASLAFDTFQKGMYFIEENYLVQQITSFVSKIRGFENISARQGIEIVREIEAQHGILIGRSKGVYSFSHLTFHEYFTSKYIIDNEARGYTKQLVKSHLEDSRWNEVFLLTASLLGDADEFISHLQTRLDEFILGKASVLEEVLSEADTGAHENELSLRTGAYRAASIYRYLQHESDKFGIQSIIDKYKQLQTSNEWSKNRLYMRIMGQPSLFDRFSVSNHSYSLIINFCREQIIAMSISFGLDIMSFASFDRQLGVQHTRAKELYTKRKAIFNKELLKSLETRIRIFGSEQVEVKERFKLTILSEDVHKTNAIGIEIQIALVIWMEHKDRLQREVIDAIGKAFKTSNPKIPHWWLRDFEEKKQEAMDAQRFQIQEWLLSQKVEDLHKIVDDVFTSADLQQNKLDFTVRFLSKDVSRDQLDSLAARLVLDSKHSALSAFWSYFADKSVGKIQSGSFINSMKSYLRPIDYPQIDNSQLERLSLLANYLRMSKLLLECINLAYLSNRMECEQRLLSMPAEYKVNR